MYVIELLHTLGLGEYVEVIVSCLPERALFGSPHHRKLQGLQAHGKQLSGRFTYQ